VKASFRAKLAEIHRSETRLPSAIIRSSVSLGVGMHRFAQFTRLPSAGAVRVSSARAAREGFAQAGLDLHLPVHMSE